MSVASLQQHCLRRLPTLAIHEISQEFDEKEVPSLTTLPQFFHHCVFNPSSETNVACTEFLFHSMRGLPPVSKGAITQQVKTLDFHSMTGTELIVAMLYFGDDLGIYFDDDEWAQKKSVSIESALSKLQVIGGFAQNSHVSLLLSKCSLIQKLFLTDAQHITDDSLRTVSVCSKLNTLYLKCVQVGAVGLSHLTASGSVRKGMTELSLDSITIDQELISELVKFEGLQKLFIENVVGINDQMLMYFCQHSKSRANLQELGLTNTVQITDAGFSSIQAFSSLQALCIENQIGVEKRALIGIDKLSKLRFLSLANNRKLQDESLQEVANLQLQQLSLRGCESLSLKGLTFLSTMGSLKVLDLSWLTQNLGQVSQRCKLPPNIKTLCLAYSANTPISHFELPESVTELDMHDANMQDKDVEALATDGHMQSSLEKLDLSGNDAVTQEGASFLTLLQALDALSLDDCGITVDEYTHLQTVLPLKAT